MPSLRLAVLKIDRSTVLPVHYTYEEGISSYSTFGYVRLSSAMLPGLTYLGRDTPAVRDAFLVELLTALAIPEERARRIVRDAEHEGAAPSAPEIEPGALRQEARNDTWELARIPEKTDFWRLTNIADRPLFPAGVTFTIADGDRNRTDEVALAMTVPVLQPGAATQMHVVGSDDVTDVVVRWRSRRSRFGRVHEWAVRF
jgi:hypothetical protein